ncbi:hypothetical protein B0H10DRAFT_457638 [Mycena sp. CBHHK59/15]|nr:hypothetical protein B0H10DRAFT_2226999 [Mycena sp. CBHHK59/15]KAJ6626798.1 hypothetical protein B0H10DRAFT_457638 [Mycena sp. CBHHK59/15]
MSVHHSVPRPGAWAVLTIDPIASVEYLDDREATLAAQKIVTQKYVVYVENNYQFFNPTIPYQENPVSFLIQGQPLASPDDCVDSSMSIPVLPAVEHPSSREPLKPSQPLPWPNCYLSPFISVEVRSPTLITTGPVDCRLDIPERLRHERLMREDWERRKELLSSKAQSLVQRRASLSSNHAFPEEAPIDSVLHPEGATSVAEPNLCAAPSMLDSDLDDHESADSASISTSEAEHEQQHEITVDLIHSILFSRVPSDNLTTVNFTHDLSGVHELNNCLGFFAEVEQLARIAEESRIRQEMAKKEAERSNAERYDKQTAKLLGRTRGRVSRILSGIKRGSSKVLRRMFFLQVSL